MIAGAAISAAPPAEPDACSAGSGIASGGSGMASGGTAIAFSIPTRSC